MASIVRPTLLRRAATAKSALSPTRAGPALSRCAALAAAQPSTTSSLLLNNAAKAAAFHATSRRNLLPPLPQTIQGTINDPAPVPHPSSSHGRYHWTFDRLIAVGLVPLTVAPFAAGSLNPTMDAVLCATLLVHAHMGLQSVLIDYLPARRVPKTRRLFMWMLNAATAVVGIGLYEFETNDVGLTEAIKRVWNA